ncbi:hypothetical protein, partial [Salmonella sp. SAL4448]|uniref:hypothetical protein n=1 Tax=Salmonella sp. SAL4448 TaxID=3159903 RepID=UPI003978C196
FKLTVGANEAVRRAAVTAQVAQGGVDGVGHNDLEEIHAASVHPFGLWRSPSAKPVRLEGVPVLAAALAEILSASPA